MKALYSQSSGSAIFLDQVMTSSTVKLSGRFQDFKVFLFWNMYGSIIWSAGIFFPRSSVMPSSWTKTASATVSGESKYRSRPLISRFRCPTVSWPSTSYSKSGRE